MPNNKTNMPPPSQPPAEAAFRAFLRTFGLLKRVMEPYFSRFGISESQWGVLRALQRAEEHGLTGLRLTDLGERLLIRPPSVTGVIDRLERTGLVQRKASQEDLRSKQVCLTQDGWKLIKHVEQFRGEQIKTVLGGLNTQQQGTLHELLDQLGMHLQTLAAQENKADPAEGPKKVISNQ